MTFDRKNRDAVHAQPTARLMLATNNRPRFSDRSGGLLTRDRGVLVVSHPLRRLVRCRAVGAALTLALPLTLAYAGGCSSPSSPRLPPDPLPPREPPGALDEERPGGAFVPAESCRTNTRKRGNAT